MGIAAISQQFTQGNITITGNSLDVAINGGGFFQQTMPDGSLAYTRAGDFKLNADGFIMTNSHGKVMGYPTDKDGVRTSSTLGPLQLPTGAPIAAQATTTITAEFNLPRPACDRGHGRAANARSHLRHIPDSLRLPGRGRPGQPLLFENGRPIPGRCTGDQ